jgi:modification methylase
LNVILASTNPGDLVLDPFFGSGTTGAAAKRLGRHWLGIEKDAAYVKAAQRRIDGIAETDIDAELLSTSDPRRRERIPFGRLLEAGLVRAGDSLVFDSPRGAKARVCADGSVVWKGNRGSIHQIARLLRGGPCNGWDHWSVLEGRGKKIPIDQLREKLRVK